MTDLPWQPRILPADLSAADLERTLGAGAVRERHDTLREQLVELVETRHPDRDLDPAELDAAIATLLDGSPLATYGNLVHYPWSGRLLRLLPEAEFRELRTSRNRHKITTTEQDRLAALSVAIVGLSVGRATAVTLVLEGIARHIRLADFDVLGLSNLNRLRAGLFDLGLPKTVSVARELYEIDPYLHLELFSEGVTDANLPALFATGDGGTIDLLFEECDDLAMKVRLREEARRRRVPVLMETSDRGMLDVERFDLEPDRPLFHGLVGDLDASRLAGLTTHEKVPIVLKILGAETLSSRMAASLVDIDTTLKTWPQLGSAIAVGGALNAIAARHIALGGWTTSGRFHVDVEALLTGGALTPTQRRTRRRAVRQSAA